MMLNVIKNYNVICDQPDQSESHVDKLHMWENCKI